jgi:hypothetical protein
MECDSERGIAWRLQTIWRYGSLCASPSRRPRRIMCTSPIATIICKVIGVFRADAPNLELEPQRQLSHASIYRCASDQTECR